MKFTKAYFLANLGTSFLVKMGLASYSRSRMRVQAFGHTHATKMITDLLPSSFIIYHITLHLRLLLYCGQCYKVRKKRYANSFCFEL